MAASMVFGGPTRLTLMTGTCSLASHPKASATASTAPPVGRPQNTSAAYRAAPGAAPWKVPARPTMSEATAVPCSARTAVPQPSRWTLLPLTTSAVTPTPLAQAARIRLARERRGRLLDVERHARRKIRQRDGRQLRQPHRRQRHLRGGRRGDHEQRCQKKPAHGSTIVERGPAGKKWKKMASMNVGPA